MPDIKALLECYREKLIILKVTLSSVVAMTEFELLESVHLKQDIAQLELLIRKEAKKNAK